MVFKRGYVRKVRKVEEEGQIQKFCLEGFGYFIPSRAEGITILAYYHSNVNSYSSASEKNKQIRHTELCSHPSSSILSTYLLLKTTLCPHQVTVCRVKEK